CCQGHGGCSDLLCFLSAWNVPENIRVVNEATSGCRENTQRVHAVGASSLRDRHQAAVAPQDADPLVEVIPARRAYQALPGDWLALGDRERERLVHEAARQVAERLFQPDERQRARLALQRFQELAERAGRAERERPRARAAEGRHVGAGAERAAEV